MSTRRWYMDRIYEKCKECLSTLSNDWPFGAILWAKQNKPDLYKRLKELEQAINSSYQGDLLKANYELALENISIYSSILKEMKALYIEAGQPVLTDLSTEVSQSSKPPF